jgi:hypothetical protein
MKNPARPAMVPGMWRRLNQQSPPCESTLRNAAYALARDGSPTEKAFAIWGFAVWAAAVGGLSLSLGSACGGHAQRSGHSEVSSVGLPAVRSDANPLPQSTLTATYSFLVLFVHRGDASMAHDQSRKPRRGSGNVASRRAPLLSPPTLSN